MLRSRLPTPTLSGGVPLLGHAVTFALRPLKFLESARDRGDVVVFRLGTKPAYLVNTPELVREVLVTEYHAFAKGGSFFALTWAVGCGRSATRPHRQPSDAVPGIQNPVSGELVVAGWRRCATLLMLFA